MSCCHHKGSERPSWRRLLALSLACAAAGLGAAVLEALGVEVQWLLPLWAASYLLGGWEAAKESLHRLRSRELEIHFLMLAVASGAAFLGEYAEGAVLLFLFSFSGALEAYATARTESAIAALAKEAPEKATLLREDGTEEVIPVERIAPGMILRLRPGDRVAADGTIESGKATFDESMLTGEALPVEHERGDPVSAGVVVVGGGADLRVVRPAAQSTLQRMIDLVLKARQEKAPAERFTDRFGGRYTVGILSGCLLFFLVLLAAGVEVNAALYRAMTLLVVAAPCALVLSIPSAILAAIAAGARRGVLFRHGGAVEGLAHISTVAFDKTGTLTTGDLSLAEMERSGDWSEAQALTIIASAELRSEHPIARSIVKEARRRGIEPTPPAEFRFVAGAGIEARVGEETVRIGTAGFLQDDGRPLPEHWLEPGVAGQIRVLVRCGDRAARLLLQDQVRSEAAVLVSRLKGAGVTPIIISGDQEAPVKEVASVLGIQQYHYRQRPEDKIARLTELRDRGERVLMVGDGVNDAAAIASADLGAVMGTRGSAATLEQGDIIIMGDHLGRVWMAMQLSHRARRIIRQNLGISLCVMMLLGLVAVGGKLPLPLAVVGHEGSTVIVVLNSLRLLFRGRDQP